MKIGRLLRKGFFRFSKTGFETLTGFEPAGSALARQWCNQFTFNVLLKFTNDKKGYRRKDKWVSLIAKETPSLLPVFYILRKLRALSRQFDIC